MTNNADSVKRIKDYGIYAKKNIYYYFPITCPGVFYIFHVALI